jgi:L-asparaginase II
MTDSFAIVARTYRGEYPESWHLGAAAVVDSGGCLVARVGDPDVRCFMRSSAKPIQALPLVVAGGPEHLDLEQEDLALLCGSHAGTLLHTERVARMLEIGGFAVDDLACGTHLPLCEMTAEEMLRKGHEPSALHSNCSGNHTGVLLACSLLGYPTAGYTDPEHPLMQRVLGLVARFCGLQVEEVDVAVDGCGLPTYRVPLIAAARAWARLADPVASDLEGDESKAVETLIEAMASCPEMVAGCGKFTTRLIEATGGRVVGKEGADGFYALAIRGSVSYGAAVKIADGTEACRSPVILDILRQLGCLSAAELEELQEFRRPPVLSRAGEVVGAIVADVDLERDSGGPS